MVRNPRRPQDLADAVALYDDAVKAGNAEAMNRLGKLYETGKGVAQNYVTASVLYERGADAGSAGAMYSGALLFEKGLGVKQSISEAMNWYREAAEAGHPMASRRMGKAYDEGTAVGINHGSAANWYCRAVMKEAAILAHPVIGRSEPELVPVRPVAEQLAMLDQCPDDKWDDDLAVARAILSRQLTPAIKGEAERLSKNMKTTNNISQVLAANP